MTKAEAMTDSVLKHVSKRDYIRKQWLDRQKQFRRMTEQDCYGVQKRRKREM